MFPNVQYQCCLAIPKLTLLSPHPLLNTLIILLSIPVGVNNNVLL